MKRKVKIYKAVSETVKYPFYFKDNGKDGLTYYSKAIDKDTILTIGIDIGGPDQLTVLYTNDFRYQKQTVYHLINEVEFTGALNKATQTLERLR